MSKLKALFLAAVLALTLSAAAPVSATRKFSVQATRPAWMRTRRAF